MGLDKSLGQIVLSQRPELCDYQINGAMNASKFLKKNPKDIAIDVITKIPLEIKNKVEFSVAGNGFINLKLGDEFLLKTIPTSLNVPKDYKKVIIDFSSPNIAKSMHVGHVRSTLIGACLVNLYRYQGSNVTADNHIGDFGTPLGIVISKIINQSDFIWNLENIEKNYVEGSIQYKIDEEFKKIVQEITVKLQNNDPDITKVWDKIVSTTVNSLKKDYSQLGIKFDTWDGESKFQSKIPLMIDSLEKKGMCVSSNGAKVIDLYPNPPLLLEKSAGGYLYHTTDLACINERSMYDLMLYVVDNRQKLHFEQLFLAAKKVEFIKDNQKAIHVAFGTINGQDNRPFKTRDGDVLKLSDLIEQSILKAKEKIKDKEFSDFENNSEIIGIGALKFAELKHHRLSDYVFDLDKFMSLEGFTGPYVMYSIVRAKSILSKTKEEGELIQINSPEERSIVLLLNQFKDYFSKSINLNEPHHLCEYSYKLANAFNSFYQNHSIVNENNDLLKKNKIALINLVINHLTVTLGLLGISVPSKM